ncbi:hypothetical protein BH10PSE1_BH10PSE1_17620 [soil metagenome]
MNNRILMTAVILTVAPLAGCDRVTAAYEAFQNPAKPASPVVAPVASATPAIVVPPLTPTSKGLPVKALPNPELQQGASVVEVHDLTKQQGADVKLFGMAGGDPAMNGLQTYIAFYRNPAEGWWVYGIGDFLNFKVLNEVPGQVDLEIEENTIDTQGVIGTKTRRAILVFPVGPVNEEQPVNLRMMPAA